MDRCISIVVGDHRPDGMNAARQGVSGTYIKSAGFCYYMDWWIGKVILQSRVDYFSNLQKLNI